jgi:hypothetical protein
VGLADAIARSLSLKITGTGDVLEPEAGIVGIGSGGNYALAAARALADGPLDAEAIVRRLLSSDRCARRKRAYNAPAPPWPTCASSNPTINGCDIVWPWRTP